YNRELLQSITQTIQHRGPDAEGLYYDQSDKFNVGLGHRRLSIIDLSSAANQPMYSNNGRYVMIYNGEVYNYKEIRNEKLSGFAFKSSGDTEVILECYSRYGSDCFQWLNGIFALAIWDLQDKKLILARDHLGIKPLYYYYQDQAFVFASEIKAIKKAIPGLKINYSVIPSFLHLGYITHPYSIYEGVKKLSAGSHAEISISRGGNVSISEHSFWKIQDKISSSILTDESIAKKKLNDLLTDSVQKQLISDVPIGTFLSGGTDSSVVTAIAAKVSSQKVKTFSIAVTDGKVNEGPYAAAVAKHLQTEHYELPITQQEILEMVPDFLNVYDEPFCDSSAFPTLLVSKLARQHVTVTLSGDGGDELFWGYNSYLWAKRLKNPLFKIASPAIYAGSRLLNNRYKRAGKLFEKHDPAYFKSHLFSQDQYFFSEKELNDFLVNPGFDFSEINHCYKGRKLSIEEQVSFWDIENYLKDDLLVKVDRASMRYGLETRVPILDYRVVEFALNLSPHLKINKGGTMKYLLKQVLYDYAPKQLFDRPKWGFSIPLVKWLKADLKWLVDKYCSKELIEEAGIVKYEQVSKMISLYQAGKNDYLYNRIWAIIVLHWFLHECQ
ncbi:MAG: asparagine synthase (glutamine-hydrolyzing), partial [Chitinophagaceae bacterium]